MLKVILNKDLILSNQKLLAAILAKVNKVINFAATLPKYVLNFINMKKLQLAY